MQNHITSEIFSLKINKLIIKLLIIFVLMIVMLLIIIYFIFIILKTLTIYIYSAIYIIY